MVTGAWAVFSLRYSSRIKSVKDTNLICSGIPYGHIYYFYHPPTVRVFGNMTTSCSLLAKSRRPSDGFSLPSVLNFAIYSIGESCWERIKLSIFFESFQSLLRLIYCFHPCVSATIPETLLR